MNKILSHKSYGSNNNPKIIILHGLFGSSRNWIHSAKQLAERFHVITVDIRNHGESFHADEMDYLTLTEDLKLFIEYHQIEKFHLMGHSLGGKVSMLFACRYPQFINKLIILDIAPKTYHPHHKEVFEGMNALKLDQVHSRQDADIFLKNYIEQNDLRQFILTNLIRNPENQFIWQINLKSLTENQNIVTQNLLNPTDIFLNPTLFIQGEKSDFILPSDHEIIYQHFPDSKIILFNNTGHNVHIENNSLFINTINLFL